jgi:hypothetical protein
MSVALYLPELACLPSSLCLPGFLFSPDLRFTSLGKEGVLLFLSPLKLQRVGQV